MSGQKKLPELFKSQVQERATVRDYEQQCASSSLSPSSSVRTVPVNVSFDVNINENESPDSHSDNENMDTQVHCASITWKVGNSLPFFFFSSSKNGWLCTICSDYEEGNKFWKTKGVEQDEHPNHKFPTHEKSKKILKGSLEMCKNDTHFQQRKSLQIYQGAATQNQKVKQRNRHIITKFLKPFFWYIYFEDVIEFLNDLGDQDTS